jgi:uncharacterized protein YggT (Ycf19 family)
MTTAIRIGRALLWLVYAWVTITLVLLLLAFILLLFGADPSAGFVQWVYRSVERAMAPFRGIFEPIVLSDQSVLDTSVLFAMIVYGFIAIGLRLAVDWVTRKLHAVERQEYYASRAEERAMAASWPATSAPRRVLQLGGPAGESASAVLNPYAGGTAIQLTATGLDPAQSYGVWLEDAGGNRTSAGTFRPDAAGVARLSLTSSASLVDSRTFGVTLLPHNGDPRSTDILAAPLA